MKNNSTACVVICDLCFNKIQSYEIRFIDNVDDNKSYHEYCFSRKYVLGIEKNIEQKIQKRDSWLVYFMKIADLVSSRSTCDRKHCGSVITLDNKIISTGYNGSEKGEPHCDDVGHFMVEGSCKRTIHAELNCLKMAKEKLETLKGCKIFINTYPCWNCFGKIYSEGIREIFYKDDYRKNELIENVAKFLDVKIERVEI